MATVNQIEDNGGNIFDIEDAAAQAKIGDLSQLETTAKNDLVSALNETQTPTQTETITTSLGTVNFTKMGRLVEISAEIQLQQIPQNPLTVLTNVDEKYLPFQYLRETLIDNSQDLPCGQAVLDNNTKILNFWFARNYQAATGRAYVIKTLYISKN